MKIMCILRLGCISFSHYCYKIYTLKLLFYLLYLPIRYSSHYIFENIYRLYYIDNIIVLIVLNYYLCVFWAISLRNKTHRKLICTNCTYHCRMIILWNNCIFFKNIIWVYIMAINMFYWMIVIFYNFSKISCVM